MNKTVSTATDRGALNRYQHMRRVYLFVAILLLSTLLLVARSAFDASRAQLYIQLCGMLCITLGILGRVWCTLYIGGRKADEVVSDGPYSIMRNPLYFFSSLAAIGAGAQTGSIIIALLFGLFCAAAFHIVIKREEAYLSGVFGKPYADYCARVPRFFPKLRLFKDPPTLNVLPQRVYATIKDGLVFFAAVPLLETVKVAQELGWLPIFFRLY